MFRAGRRIFALSLFFLLTIDFSQASFTKIAWTTNNKDPEFSSPEAKQGGTWTFAIPAFPLTFRVFGPNVKDYFANWRNVSCQLKLVDKHPDTGNPIPILATHWSETPDHLAVYYQLDPTVTFNDGKPVTAEDYVFAFETIKNPDLQDVLHKSLYENLIEKVEMIERDVLKITGKKPSWRPLEDFQIVPLPKHAMKLHPRWVEETNWQPFICPGPYRIGDFKRGRFLNLDRVKPWWGDQKKYLKHRFNFDRIQLVVIPDETQQFERFKKGDLSGYEVLTSSLWVQETDFDAVKKGWVVKKRVFNQISRPMHGIAFNLRDPILSNLSLRKALQYLFDFEKINKNLMFGAYYRKGSMFEGTSYANPSLKPYSFDPKKAEEYLKKSGYAKRGEDGIRVNAQGQRLSLTLLEGTPEMARHWSIFQEDLRKEGVELKIQMADAATAFKKETEGIFQLKLIYRVPNPTPNPRYYFHSSFKAGGAIQGNFFGYDNPKADQLIEVFEHDLDPKKRQKAMWDLDRMLYDDSVIIQGWIAPYVRMLYWNRYGTPRGVIPQTATLMDQFFTFYLDPALDQKLKTAQEHNQELPLPLPIDETRYKIKGGTP